MLNDNWNKNCLKLYNVSDKLKLSIENISNNNLYKNNDYIIIFYYKLQQINFNT